MQPRAFQVGAPNFIAGADLQQRLRGFDARIATGGDDATEVRVERPAALQSLLRAVEEWVQDWRLAEVELKLGHSSYRLRSHGIGWIDASDADLDLGFDDLDVDP